MLPCCKPKKRTLSRQKTDGSLKQHTDNPTNSPDLNFDSTAAEEPLLTHQREGRPPPLETQLSDVSLRVLAAQTLKIASINGLGDTEKLETELEDEIRWEESRRPPREILGRIRRRCEEILHAKPMLLFIVVLNVIDCLLVIGELTLDFHHLSDRILTLTEYTEEFLNTVKERPTPELDDVDSVYGEDLTRLFNHLLGSFVFWNASTYSQDQLVADCQPFVAYNSSSSSLSTGLNVTTPSINGSGNVLLSLLAFAAAPVQSMGPMNRDYYDVVGTAHALHYTSLSILSFLLAETLLKISCVGRRFLKKRMEMFDAVVIVVSFTLDIIFVEGLTDLHIHHYVIVLSFLLPWRVLRVLNSLIVAVMVQHRFHLKLLYKQKRKINKQLQESTDNTKSLEKQVELLKGLCSSNGVPEWQINKAIGQSLTASGQSGLKALSKLVFHAAESFAPLSGSQKHLNTVGNSASSSDVMAASASSPSITIQCNGDLEQGGPSNGHVHVLQEESHLEDETATPPNKASRTDSLSSARDSGLESRCRYDDDDDDDDDSPGAERPPEISGGEEKGLGVEEEGEEEGMRRQQDLGEERTEGGRGGRDEAGSWNPTSSPPPLDSCEAGGGESVLNEVTSVTRL